MTAQAADLIGSWRMVSWTRMATATAETTDALGPDPLGYIACHADGRMMATVFRRDRARLGDARWSDAEKAALFDPMLACVARWTLEADRVIHHIEGAWSPDWEIDLSRPFAPEGDRLTIGAAPGVDPITGEAVLYAMAFRKV